MSRSVRSGPADVRHKPAREIDRAPVLKVESGLYPCRPCILRAASSTRKRGAARWDTASNVASNQRNTAPFGHSVYRRECCTRSLPLMPGQPCELKCVCLKRNLHCPRLRYDVLIHVLNLTFAMVTHLSTRAPEFRRLHCIACQPMVTTHSM